MMIRISFVTTTPDYIGDSRINNYCELRNFDAILKNDNDVYYIDTKYMHYAFDIVNLINDILTIKWLHIDTLIE